VLHAIVEGKSSSRVISEHQSDEVEHLLPVYVAALLSRDVAGEGFHLGDGRDGAKFQEERKRLRRCSYSKAIYLPPNMTTCATVLIPLKLALGEVLKFGSLDHLHRKRAQHSLHHGEMFH